MIMAITIHRIELEDAIATYVAPAQKCVRFHRLTQMSDLHVTII